MGTGKNHKQMHKSSKRYMYKMLYNPRLKLSTLLKFKQRMEGKPRLKVHKGKR